MWRHIAQSLQGPSHLDDDTPCQDTHSVRVLGEDSRAHAVACVADGAGSAKHSEIGSAIACEATMSEHATHFLKLTALDALQLDDVFLWCDDIRERASGSKPMNMIVDVREFATTLVRCDHGPELSVFFQIGDGAIILGNESLIRRRLLAPVWRIREFHKFLNIRRVSRTTRIHHRRRTVAKIALMTDGMERLALRFDVQTPHVPFFDPLFKALQGVRRT